jgi:hypothetical protein
MPVAARLIIEVQAGILVGEPMPEYSRRWTWTSVDHDRLEAGEYAASLENPRTLNWVRRDWIWL